MVDTAPAGDAAPAGTVGFVGVGMMGAPMARCIALSGIPVTVYDVDPDKAAAAVAGPDGRVIATVAGNLEALADNSMIITMLPTSDIVESVLLDAGLAMRLKPGTLVADMSSSEPARTIALGTRLADMGLPMLDAPVSGGVARAKHGNLTVMVGGSDDDLRRATPVLERMAGRIFHVGALGAGHAAKALNNVLSACGLLIATEATEVAHRFGLEPEVFLDLVNHSTGRNDATENKMARFVLSETYNSGFAAALMAKDLRIARGLAASTGAPTRLLRALVDAWQEAIDGLPPGADQTEVGRYLASGRQDVVAPRAPLPTD